MTTGELARLYNGEKNLGADVRVVRMENWRRTMVAPPRSARQHVQSVGRLIAASGSLVPRLPAKRGHHAPLCRAQVGVIVIEEALQAGSADLIAVGREALYDPNWPLHAAQALGADPQMEGWPVQYGWWLTRREGLLRKLGVRK